jgi:hypothetical protein
MHQHPKMLGMMVIETGRAKERVRERKTSEIEIYIDSQRREAERMQRHAYALIHVC